jgi:hypothetical protein
MFDPHITESLGSTNQSHAAKRGGAGRGNWGKDTDATEAEPVAAEAEEVAQTEVSVSCH